MCRCGDIAVQGGSYAIQVLKNFHSLFFVLSEGGFLGQAHLRVFLIGSALAPGHQAAVMQAAHLRGARVAWVRSQAAQEWVHGDATLTGKQPSALWQRKRRPKPPFS